jgi:hypothetical protein
MLLRIGHFVAAASHAQLNPIYLPFGGQRGGLKPCVSTGFFGQQLSKSIHHSYGPTWAHCGISAGGHPGGRVPFESIALQQHSTHVVRCVAGFC